MPWTGTQFKERHNHGLSPGQADHAARIANAILKRSGNDRIAIATANKLVERAAGGWLPHRDTGDGRAGGGSTVRRDQDTYDVQLGEKLGEGWHSYMNRSRTGNPSADTGMRTSSPNSLDGQMEISRGQYGGLGSRTDYAPNPQGAWRGGWMPHRDSGGGMDPTSAIGGLTPSASTQNPVVQSLVQRYSGLSTEKLQELSMALGSGSAQGKIVSALLNQRRTMPNTVQQSQQQQQTQQSSLQPQQQQSSSGMQPGAAQQGQQTQSFAYGGDPMGISVGMAEPWWTRREASSADSGYLSGSSLGRADAVHTTAPSSSYVLPADVISGLGEGNGQAGARIVQEMTSTGPHGTPLPRITHGRGPPSAPRLSQSAVNAFEAKGGGVQDSGTPRTDVALSHGEVVLSPAQCVALVSNILGYEVNLKTAHRVLDSWVVEERKRHIKELQKLPGPVGAKKEKK